MSDNLILEDGRTWWASTVNVASVLSEIADALKHKNVEFSTWLSDKSDRPSPFMHFDLRGLPEECVDQFHIAASESFNRLREEHGERFVNSSYGVAFNRLIEMHKHMKKGGKPEEFTDLEVIPIYNGEKIDFNELWSDS